jgi:serine/threonine-protein kinase HipA
MTRFELCLDLDSVAIPMAEVSVDDRDGRTRRCEFSYRDDYLARPGRLALDPRTPVTGDRWVSAELPRGLGDAGPDGWGRSLLLRRHRGRAMSPTDLLLGVDDAVRIGALRVRTEDGWQASPGSGVPALIHLADLQRAADQVESDGEADDAVRQLVGAGSASLGGMRPKASVRNDAGQLAIAKFSSARDQISVIAWEKLCLDLAADAGIEVPRNRLLRIGGRPVLVLDRFDRTPEGHRVPYLSAFAITDAADAASGDYLYIAEALTDLDTADMPATVQALWRRAAFNVAVRNTDDHLRNHAILWHRDGWRLSPAFDITVNEIGGSYRTTQIAGETSPGREARGLTRLAEEFGLTTSTQAGILADILRATARWREHAASLGIPTVEISQLQRPLDDARDRLTALASRLD